MFFSRPRGSYYTSVETFEPDEEKSNSGTHSAFALGRTDTSVKIGLYPTLFLSFLLCMSTISTWALFFQRSSLFHQVTPQVQAQWQCAKPAIRQEWRSLTSADKSQYIAAVQCLERKPSRVRNNGTLYDDFPWVHKSTSTDTHEASSFLPWHRYFIHIYERALIDDCAFTGTLPYWDWSLDWEDFTSAPIWGENGFGSNGSPDSESSVGDGHCVVDGPFAGLQAMYYDNKYYPHCLSRGFQSGIAKKELGKLVHPETIAKIMEEDDYEAFALQLERNAHRFLSQSIRGEFSKFTGPYDPVFFLHHANLDRLWWQWQMKNPETRLHAYDGKAQKNEIRAASLNDNLDLGGLRHDIAVSEVMETKSGLFCYEYPY